jgi:phosphonate transport system permease protein
MGIAATSSGSSNEIGALIARAMAISPDAVALPWGKRLRAWFVAGLFLLVFFAACRELDLSLSVLIDGTGKLGAFLVAMWPPSDGGQPVHLFYVVIQTLAMAVIGTAVATVLAVPIGMAAARNLVPNPVIHFAIRRFLDLFRGIPVLVWALIMVAAFGLGPVPGILAIILTDIPRLGKLFAEAMENVDDRQIASLRVTGASAFTILRFGALPQMLPVWLSQCLYFLEQNFRSAAIVGVVGGGGIGFELQERIRIFAFDEVAFITLLYIVAVGVLDVASDRLRARLT